MKKIAPLAVIAVLIIAGAAWYYLTPDNQSVSADDSASIEEFDITRCESFEAEEDRKICETKLVYEQIFRTQDISYCDYLSEEEREQCRLKAVIHSVKKGAGISLCDKLDESVREDCRYNIILQAVNYGADPEMCDLLTDTSNQKICRERHGEAQKILAKLNSTVTGINNFLQKDNDNADTGVQTDEVSTASLEESEVYSDAEISVFELPHAPRVQRSSQKFYKTEGHSVGIDVNPFTALDLNIPFNQGRGIASGDFDNDGWTDLVFALNGGIKLYKNDGKGHFVHIALENETLSRLDTFLTGFVDINNDGWLDIYVTSYGEGQYFIVNDKAGFKETELLPVEAPDRIIAMAAPFADIDKDGDLDFYHGYLSHSTHENRDTTQSSNHLIINNDLHFELQQLEQEAGETLTALFSDINLDGNMDLLVGNDFEGPDALFYGEEGGNFKPIVKSDNIIPVTAQFTMSYDTADINNDLLPDIFSVDLGDLTSYTQDQVNNDYCLAVENLDDRKKCAKILKLYDAIKKIRPEECLESDDDLIRDECLLAVMVNLAEKGRNLELCNKIPDSYQSQKNYCENVSIKGIKDYHLPSPEQIEQKTENALLIAREDGTYTSASQYFGVNDSFWSWNAKFADLDNDGWQDIYVGNGYDFNLHRYTTNVFFHNENGERFLVRQEEFGLSNYLHTSAYTYIDIDNDGDLDIVSASNNGPAVVMFNNDTQNKSITIEIRDKQGNYFGIGAKVYVYTENGAQMRELKAGGGYLSFDSPMLHFGLGNTPKISKIVVNWPEGQETVIEHDFSTDRKYIIVRE